jgi:(2Fe-2S) ferredoxin
MMLSMIAPDAPGRDEAGLVVYVCEGPCCVVAGREPLRRALAEWVARAHPGRRVRVEREICFGHCHQGPNALCAPETGALYGLPPVGTPGALLHHRVTLEELMAIVEARLGERSQAGP